MSRARACVEHAECAKRAVRAARCRECEADSSWELNKEVHSNESQSFGKTNLQQV